MPITEILLTGNHDTCVAWGRQALQDGFEVGSLHSIRKSKGYSLSDFTIYTKGKSDEAINALFKAIQSDTRGISINSITSDGDAAYIDGGRFEMPGDRLSAISKRNKEMYGETGNFNNGGTMQITLGRLIERLRQEPQGKVLKQGFDNPHSYRGFYDELAFEPIDAPVPIREMLAAATSAVNKVFKGYKGGDYQMDEHTTVWLSPYGESGDVPLSEVLLDKMLANMNTGDADTEALSPAHQKELDRQAWVKTLKPGDEVAVMDAQFHQCERILVVYEVADTGIHLSVFSKPQYAYDRMQGIRRDKAYYIAPAMEEQRDTHERNEAKEIIHLVFDPRNDRIKYVPTSILRQVAALLKPEDKQRDDSTIV